MLFCKKLMSLGIDSELQLSNHGCRDKAPCAVLSLGVSISLGVFIKHLDKYLEWVSCLKHFD